MLRTWTFGRKVGSGFAVTIIALISLHLYLVIRLGVTSPPWSKEATGTGPLVEGEGAAPAPAADAGETHE